LNSGASAWIAANLSNINLKNLKQKFLNKNIVETNTITTNSLVFIAILRARNKGLLAFLLG